MTQEQLERGKELSEQIENYKENLKRAQYTQYESVVIRESFLRFNGIEGSVKVPKNLFRTIGKLIVEELTKEIYRLENEFESL